MKASEYAKKHGLKSLTEAASMGGLTTKCLRDWFNKERTRFEIYISGCAEEKKNKSLK